MVKATDGFCAVQGALYNLYIAGERLLCIKQASIDT